MLQTGKMNLILFDDEHWTSLLPLTYTRPVAELRVGIFTIREKWEKLLECQVSYITQDYLSEKFPIILEDDNFIVNSTVLPTPYIVNALHKLEKNSAIVWGDVLVAARLNRSEFDQLQVEDPEDQLDGIDIQNDEESFIRIQKPHDIFSNNKIAIQLDFDLVEGDDGAKLSEDIRLVNPSEIKIEAGAKLSNCILNASTGPIYISKDAEIMDGAVIRGPFAMLEGAVCKMSSKIYGPTTLGPYVKVGGELNNVVFQGYSNKAHDGYLGNSVIGEWCNFGADTNNSNLKNNYSEVKLFDYNTEKFESTGLLFCGLIMGDHSKTGINSMFNTGSVVGVGCNIYGSGFPRNFIPGFSWGGAQGFQTYRLQKMLDVAKIVLGRKSLELTQADINILTHIFHSSSRYRNWE